MNNAITAALLLTSTIASADLPQEARVPGGLAVVAVANPASVVTVDGRRQPVLTVNGEHHAVIGIPLSATNEVGVAIDGNTVTLALADAGYREQHITIERQDYVTPSEHQLARYRRERAALDAAINRFSVRKPLRWPWPAPVVGRQSDSFGARRFFNGEPRRPHSGMDITAASGTPIVAPTAGEVVLVDDLFFNGNTVVVDHGNGVVSLYCHLSATDVAVGDAIDRGQTLGRVGATGRVTGAHLH
ncbi:MAG: peptidoglycan DD-metalloendopeptidase family protein [Pseudomonadota bacterium]